ncbi:hypothetical protein GF342_00395 [Candidatus Woesearchaeota archaeon]|nr:hypothetical protein [Candidatus Woesearchaeota archaeon]
MKRITVLVILLLCAFGVAAFSFDVQISPDERSIRMNETAEFDMTITHDSSETVYITMYTLDIRWDVSTKDVLRVPPQGLTTKLRIRQVHVDDPAFYLIPITFSARQFGVVKKETPLVGLKPLVDTPRLYTPSVRSTVHIAESVDPRQPITYSLEMENLNPRNITEMTLYVRSNLINAQHAVTLGPDETKTVTFTADLDPDLRPQEDELRATLVTEHENRTIRMEASPVAFRVAEYGEVAEELQSSSSFLRTRDVVTLTNNGNDVKRHTYRFDVSWFDNLFSSTEPSVEREDGVYVWTVQLDPEESKTIVVSKNYWPILIFIIIALLALGAYYMFRAPVVVKKNIRRHHGGKELSIHVQVRNRSRSPVDISLVEKVPKVFEVLSEFGPGHVKPSAVATLKSKSTHDTLGTRIKWEFKNVEGRQEVFVTYKIRSRVQMIGTITLDPIIVHFSAGDKKGSVQSNKAQFIVK